MLRSMGLQRVSRDNFGLAAGTVPLGGVGSHGDGVGGLRGQAADEGGPRAETHAWGGFTLGVEISESPHLALGDVCAAEKSLEPRLLLSLTLDRRAVRVQAQGDDAHIGGRDVGLTVTVYR